MPKQPIISPEIQAEVQKRIDEFNRENFNHKELKELGIVGYSARFKGKYLYLDRDDYGKPSPICRLEWTGAMEDWDFAIYKYSGNCYDPEDWFFPGSESVDGTLEGAMQAGMEAYPM